VHQNARIPRVLVHNYRLLIGAAASLGLVLATGACGGTPSSAPGAAPSSTASAPETATTAPPTTTPATTAPPTTAPPTTAPPITAPPTTALPAAPQPSAQQAADTLVSDWATGNRPVALSVAVPAAVNALFAVPYPSGNAVFRGCSDAFPPLVCSYGPPALGSGSLFEIYVNQTPGGGRYVSSVVVET